MALVLLGKTPCAICGKVLVDAGDVVGFGPLGTPSDDPISIFSDAAVHQDCFDHHPLSSVVQQRWDDLQRNRFAHLIDEIPTVRKFVLRYCHSLKAGGESSVEATLTAMRTEASSVLFSLRRELELVLSLGLHAEDFAQLFQEIGCDEMSDGENPDPSNVILTLQRELSNGKIA